MQLPGKPLKTTILGKSNISSQYEPKSFLGKSKKTNAVRRILGL